MDESGQGKRGGMLKALGWIAAGVGAVAAGAAGVAYVRDKRTPRPGFATEVTDGPFEIRRYAPILTAETVRRGPRERALNDGFGLLADYIFAESREGPTIAMTAPVLAEPEGGDWRIRFVMPEGWTRATLPAATAGVEIGELPGRTIAALRFTGRADDRLLERKERELRDWIAARWLAPAGPAIHAFYNSPFIPGPLRHNEVLLPVRPIPQAPPVGTK